jgi:hypothetical protein
MTRALHPISVALTTLVAPAAGRQLTTLLKEHIVIAADLIAAARKGDQPETAAQQARWNDDADRIAAFLSAPIPAGSSPR